MVATLASCRTALVGTGWTSSHLVSKNRHRNQSSFVGVPFLDLYVGSFQSGGVFVVRES